MVSLPGCDGTDGWWRSPGAATAYAAPLAADTTVVTTRRVWTSSGPETTFSPWYGMIMPDGAGMASMDRETGGPAVFDLASREFNRIRINDEPFGVGTAMLTIPSPDGSRVAVILSERAGRQRQLRIIDVATGQSRTIMTADTANADGLWLDAWTPAGDSVFASTWSSRLPFRARDVQVLLISAAGGTPRLVHTFPKGVAPDRKSVSPDGRWLLYDHAPSGEQQIRSDISILDVQLGGARPLVEHPGVDRLVGWLPGTDVVLFSSDRSGTTDLWSVRVVNGRASAEPRRVRTGFFKSEAVGFGDGALFYRVRTGSYGPGVINVDPRTGALHGPVSPPLEHLSSPPSALTWSPDGEALAAPHAGNAIMLHSMETGESRLFWLDEGVVPFRMEWAADGKALFVRAGKARGMVPTGPHHFLRLDLVTGATTRLFAEEDPEEPPSLWSFLVTPDGRSIVLRQQRTLDDGRAVMKLVLRSLEDGSDRELYRTSGYIPEFSLSADGTQLAFMQQVWEHSDSLFVMTIDGSQPIQHLANWRYDEVSLLGWLPGGNALLGARLTGPYSGSRAEDWPREEILRIELDGSATVAGISPFRPTRGARHVQGYHRSRLLLSPAGNRLAHHVVDFGEELWRMDGLHELFARDSNGRR